MTKAFFVDTTTCTACRGCQVACKQWQGLSGRQDRQPRVVPEPRRSQLHDLQARAHDRGRDRQEAEVALLPGPVPALRGAALPGGRRRADRHLQGQGHRRRALHPCHQGPGCRQHHFVLPLQHPAQRAGRQPVQVRHVHRPGDATACCRPASRPAPPAP